ncbi:uncharacterized protein [Nicotiana sylvestris]|uniref:uncharacterized protein n=1 Tax=Nicotiana sylvestris TaxID=4096 RepID=UPI00388C4E14
MDELIGNLKTYEMKRKKDSERSEPKMEKNLVLKAEMSDSSDKESDMAYLTKRFQKMALAAWGDSSSESERESDAENSSMMAVKTEATKYDSLFALMARSDDDDEEEEDKDDEVNFRDVQRNLKSYSSKKLRSLSNVLIDAYYSLVNDKEILTEELGETEQSRDDLLVCIVDLNKTIANLELEKEALNKKITSVENERNNLMKTIEGLNREHKNISIGKGKEVASESHILLEKELTAVKPSLCSELEKNQQLQSELEKVRNDLEKSLKWAWSSNVVTTMYLNNSGNKQGIGFQREKTPYNPHNKYVTIPDNWLCIHCGNNGHFKENCPARDSESYFGNPVYSYSFPIFDKSSSTMTTIFLFYSYKALEDDPDQYLNSSMLDSATLKELPEKEAAHSIMAIAAERLMSEGEYISSEY